MKEIKIDDTTDDPDPSVEQRWFDLLTSRGIEQQQALNIISSIQAHPRLDGDHITPETVSDLIGRSIRDHPFDSYDTVTDRDQLVDDMLSTLHEGVFGQRPGPVALPETDDEPEKDPFEGLNVDRTAFSAGSADANADRPYAFTQSGIDVETVEQLKTDIDNLVTENELSLDDIAAFVKHRQRARPVVDLLEERDADVHALEIALEELGVDIDMEESG